MSHSKRVLFILTLMCLAFALGCGKKDEEASPAPAPAPAPSQPTPPSPPQSGGGGLPASVEEPSPGTPIAQMQDTSTYFQTLSKNITQQGTGTIISKTRSYYTINWGNQQATLQPSGSPQADNEVMNTLSLGGFFQQGWGGFWGGMGWGSISVSPNPAIPSGFSFTQSIEVVTGSRIIIYSTDQVALLRGTQTGFASQWIMKVLVGPANPPMQIFFVDAINQQNIFIRQFNINTTFR